MLEVVFVPSHARIVFIYFLGIHMVSSIPATIMFDAILLKFVCFESVDMNRKCGYFRDTRKNKFMLQ